LRIEYKHRISRESHLVDDMSVDSVDFWEIIAKVEQEFGVDVEDDDVKGVNIVQDVLNVLKKKVAKA